MANQPIQGGRGAERPMVGGETIIASVRAIEVNLRGRVRSAEGSGRDLTDVGRAINTAAIIARRTLRESAVLKDNNSESPAPQVKSGVAWNPENVGNRDYAFSA